MKDLINKLKADDVTFAQLDALMRDVDALPKADVAKLAEAVTSVKPAASASKAEMIRSIHNRVRTSINTRRRMEDTQSIF